MTQTTNYWHTTTEFPTPPAQPLPTQVEVAIMGAGYTGLTAAYTLARAGVRVAVFEAQTVGWGASSRNGGMALTGLKLGAETLVKKYGRELAQRLFAASLAAIETVETLIKTEGIACDFARCGHLEVAWKPAHYAAYEQAAEVMQTVFNHRTLQLVPKAELATEIGSPLYHGGLVDTTSAGLNPARYVAGLGRATLQAGAQIFERTPVLAVEKRAGGWQLRTATQVVQAQKVLVATSGYTTTPALQKRIFPIGSYIIATAPLPPALAQQVNPRQRMIFDSKHFLYYFRLTPDQRLLFGGRAAFWPETPHTVRDSARLLHQALLTVHPQLQAIPVEYAWGGNLDFALDVMPHMGQRDGLYYALGYAGHGVALATYLGQQVAHSMLQSATDNPFAAIPFPTTPINLYQARFWFLPLVELWYKALDQWT